MTDQPRFQPAAPVSPGEILRSAFDRLTPADQFRAMREGWRVVDDPPGSERPVTISRSAYDRMPAVGQALFTARGGRVLD